MLPQLAGEVVQRMKTRMRMMQIMTDDLPYLLEQFSDQNLSFCALLYTRQLEVHMPTYIMSAPPWETRVEQGVQDIIDLVCAASLANVDFAGYSSNIIFELYSRLMTPMPR